MFLTLFYMIATWMKAWQLRSIRTKLLQHVSADSCVVLYKVPDDVEECSRACSGLCTDPKDAHISEILAVKGSACACALRPTRNLSLDTWRAPPSSPGRLALLPSLERAPVSQHARSAHSTQDVVLPGTSKGRTLATEEVSVLLECDLSGEDIEEFHILPESDAWHVVAWRVAGSQLALALKGDMERLTSLAATFLNNQGPLARLQTVKFVGNPINLTEKECAAVSRATIHGSPRHRSKYLTTLEKISKLPPLILENSYVQLPPTQNKNSHIKDKIFAKKTGPVEHSKYTHAEKVRPDKTEHIEKIKTDKIDHVEKVKPTYAERVENIPPVRTDRVENVKPAKAENMGDNKPAVAEHIENSKPDKEQHFENGKEIVVENVKMKLLTDSDIDFTDKSKQKAPLILRKSDLKLELSNKSAPEKPHPKTVTLLSNTKTTVSHKKTVTKSLGKRSSSKSSILDEPIAIGEKANKGGGSCPSLPIVRPPNILVYSDSAVTRENIARTLRSVLDPDRYAVYCSGDESSLESIGPMGASLLVVGGALPPRASAILLQSLLGGARVLSLCSDLLLTVLPYYRTAEVRERELASFTYDKWSSVKLLHHVFCYQASPARRQFSAAPTAHPTEYKGHSGHVLRVEVLAAEQTWHTPSLLQATDERSGGTAVFSQVHLELDAREYLSAEGGSAESARLGVLRKLLTALGLFTAPSPLVAALAGEPQYTPAYFLGTYERKLEAAKQVAVGRVQLIQPKDTVPFASPILTPLLLHACPDNFSTLMYFQELRTKDFGRLVIYAEMLTSTQDVINEQARAHGLVIIADRQTKGMGRGGSIWMSPPGCLTFSLQIHSTITEGGIAARAPLLQHLVAVAAVSSVRYLPGYEDLDLRIKWPNDIYFGRSIKLGGLILNTHVIGDHMVFNIGIGINLDNSSPTKCLNDLIKDHNKELPALEREKLLALILNRLEYLYERIKESNDLTELFDLYYKYWLHRDEEVNVLEEGTTDTEPIRCRILGLDEYGYLRASGPNGNISLRPDGNTFDMMRGLIAPKIQLSPK